MDPTASRTPFAANLTALVLSYNEAANIRRTLERLRWVPRVILLDSFSTDETLSMSREFQNVEVLQRGFDSFAQQCNWGLSQIVSEWAFSLDADYVLTNELIAEITALPPAPAVAGYSARFRYCVDGVALRNTLLPPRTVLYRKSAATYHNEGHGHRVCVDGPTRQLNGYILHDDRKPLSRWINSQLHYGRIEARHLLAVTAGELSPQDRLRLRIYFAPGVVFLYLLFARGLILDGWRGWFYVAQRTIAELLLSLRLLIEKHGLEEGEAEEMRPEVVD